MREGFAYYRTRPLNFKRVLTQLFNDPLFQSAARNENNAVRPKQSIRFPDNIALLESFCSAGVSFARFPCGTAALGCRSAGAPVPHRMEKTLEKRYKPRKGRPIIARDASPGCDRVCINSESCKDEPRRRPSPDSPGLTALRQLEAKPATQVWQPGLF